LFSPSQCRCLSLSVSKQENMVKVREEKGKFMAGLRERNKQLEAG